MSYVLANIANRPKLVLTALSFLLAVLMIVNCGGSSDGPPGLPGAPGSPGANLATSRGLGSAGQDRVFRAHIQIPGLAGVPKKSPRSTRRPCDPDRRCRKRSGCFG